jgi:hypothetical protein
VNIIRDCNITTMADSRDNAVIRGAMARAQQHSAGPARGPVNSRGSTASVVGSSPATVNVNVVFDQPFGATSSQIDDLRFTYVGVSPDITRYQGMASRRDNMASVSSFRW